MKRSLGKFMGLEIPTPGYFEICRLIYVKL